MFPLVPAKSDREGAIVVLHSRCNNTCSRNCPKVELVYRSGRFSMTSRTDDSLCLLLLMALPGFGPEPWTHSDEWTTESPRQEASRRQLKVVSRSSGEFFSPSKSLCFFSTYFGGFLFLLLATMPPCFSIYTLFSHRQPWATWMNECEFDIWVSPFLRFEYPINTTRTIFFYGLSRTLIPLHVAFQSQKQLCET